MAGDGKKSVGEFLPLYDDEIEAPLTKDEINDMMNLYKNKINAKPR